MANATQKVHVFSFYTGKGSDETASRELNEVLKKHDMPEMFRSCAAWDSSALCQRVLTASTTHGSKVDERLFEYNHVFGDFQDHLHPDLAEYYATLEEANQGAFDSKQAATKVMLEEYKNCLVHAVDSSSLFPNKSPTGHCSVHAQQCPLFDVESAEELVHKAKKMKPSSPWRKVSPLVGAVAGTSCEDFSRYGKRLGEVGPKMRSFLSFAAIVQQREFDWLALENVESFPEQLLSEHFKGYEFITGVLSPLDLGWPIRRPRRYSFGWRANKFRFMGSWDDLKQTMCFHEGSFSWGGGGRYVCCFFNVHAC